MTSPFLVLLLAGCSRLPGCAEAPPAPVEPVPVVAPAAQQWPHPWQWAAVVRVDASAATPAEIPPSGLGSPPAAPEPAPAPEPEPEPAPAPDAVPGTDPIVAPPAGGAPSTPTAAGPSTLELSMVRDALAAHPVSVWQAAPGVSLAVPGGAPDVAGQALTWTVPADAVDGSWLVATDIGVHPLTWDAEHAVREVLVALGLEPWRVIVAVGTDRELGAERDAEVVQDRLRQHGVVVVAADGSGPVGVPWADLPLHQLDLVAALSGAPAGFVLAAQDQPPRYVAVERPVRLLREASSYFGVDLLPDPPAGAREGKAGKAARGPRGKAPRGKAARPEGKARKRPQRDQGDGGGQ